MNGTTTSDDMNKVYLGNGEKLNIHRNVAPHSVEINRTSTGKVSWSAKAYGDSVEEIVLKLKDMIREAEQLRSAIGE